MSISLTTVHSFLNAGFKTLKQIEIAILLQTDPQEARKIADKNTLTKVRKLLQKAPAYLFVLEGEGEAPVSYSDRNSHDHSCPTELKEPSEKRRTPPPRKVDHPDPLYQRLGKAESEGGFGCFYGYTDKLIREYGRQRVEERANVIDILVESGWVARSKRKTLADALAKPDYLYQVPEDYYRKKYEQANPDFQEDQAIEETANKAPAKPSVTPEERLKRFRYEAKHLSVGEKDAFLAAIRKYGYTLEEVFGEIPKWILLETA